MKPPVLAGGALVVVVALIAVAAPRLQGRASEPAGTSLVDRFFSLYVDPDGRVVRRDQGGDTVSEGQAYALLLAAATGDRGRFDHVWGWTRTNLQRPDGLLAYHWQGGRVVDVSPATDADLDAARALVVAAGRFDDLHYLREGLRIARAVVAGEMLTIHGRTYALAGPWARSPPFFVNPSYFAPQTWRELRDATGDSLWARLGRDARSAVFRLLRSGLPPDWARVGASGDLLPSGPPEARDTAPTYGPDAQRLPLRYAESCDEQDTRVAAALWPRLRRTQARGGALSYTLAGRVTRGGEHALGVLSAAAAAAAAGNGSAAHALLDRAERIDRSAPSYYGSAWVALGHILLTSRALGGCPKLP